MRISSCGCRTEEYLKTLTEDNAVAARNAAVEQGFEIKEAHAETTSGNYRLILTVGDPSKANEIRDAIEKKKPELRRSNSLVFFSFRQHDHLDVDEHCAAHAG